MPTGGVHLVITGRRAVSTVDAEPWLSQAGTNTMTSHEAE